MSAANLDQIHRERIDKLADNLPNKRSQALSRIFVGERVLKTIDEPKIILEGYNLDRILSVLPFSPVVYVMTCPGCATKSDEIKKYLTLVRNNLIIPVLTASYALYDSALVDELRTRDHVSYYELELFQTVQAMKLSEGRYVCDHCFEERKSKIGDLFKGVKGAPVLREFLDDISGNLQPRIYPDVELLDELETAVKSKDLDKIVSLRDLAEVIRQIRWAQIWNGTLTFDADDLALMPGSIRAELDTARRTSAALRTYVSEGLGVRIPVDIPIEQYAEIVREYQPRITAVADGVIDKVGRATSAFEAAGKQISQMNNEISRIQRMKRYMLLEAMAAPVRNNKALVAAGLTAGLVFGLGGSLVGCASVLAVKGGIRFVRNSKAGNGAIEALSKYGEVRRLFDQLRADAQPYFDELLAKYLQAKLPAVSVLAMRKGLEELNHKEKKPLSQVRATKGIAG